MLGGKPRHNNLRLDRGAVGEGEVFFGGWLDKADVVIGRGRSDLQVLAFQGIHPEGLQAESAGLEMSIP